MGHKKVQSGITKPKRQLVRMAIKNEKRALAGVAQWIERQPANQRVTGSIPSQGTGLGCGPGPQYGV